jgi:sigma-B regulation protein RsbU (phosphoserine phosphatase)
VAGDFYDFFSLPGNRLGIVIADVADKGMPAALFMSLVRALMRATVLQFDSPAEVLSRVNDVLVPDAQQGMFVTLFYAVVCLESGEICYANAGHNPPFFFSNTKARDVRNEPFRLEKGEIALGVLDECKFSNRVVQLGQGDFLVLYTDGITEAFSEANEMYGEDGLSRTIQAAVENAEQLTAESLLKSIDLSVRTYIGDVPLADDLTILVIRRRIVGQDE